MSIRNALVVTLGCASAAKGQSFRTLGVLPGAGGSAAKAISADGSTIVGICGALAPIATPRPFRWTDAGGMVELPLLPGGVQGWATSVSSDGSVVAGYTQYNQGVSVACSWDATGVQSIGPFPSGSNSTAVGVSGDGQRIVGNFTPFNAYSWTQQGGPAPLPPLTATNVKRAWGISTDGRTVVGESASGTTYTAVRWTDAGVQELGNQPGVAATFARAASADGLVIVGGVVAAGPGDRGFRWTAAEGMVHFDVLPGGTHSTAKAMSGDGFVVVGDSNLENQVPAVFFWTPVLGMQDLRAFLVAQGVNMQAWPVLDAAAGVSAHGRSIVGESTGSVRTEAWLATLPAWAVCYANCDGSSTPPALNIADFTCFINKYSADDPYANCDNSSTPPVLNVSDFICFQQKYSAGCP